jgi:hypothetical protein
MAPDPDSRWALARGPPSTRADVAACFGGDETRLTRWMTPANLSWETLVQETERG